MITDAPPLYVFHLFGYNMIVSKEGDKGDSVAHTTKVKAKLHRVQHPAPQHNITIHRSRAFASTLGDTENRVSFAWVLHLNRLSLLYTSVATRIKGSKYEGKHNRATRGSFLK